MTIKTNEKTGLEGKLRDVRSGDVIELVSTVKRNSNCGYVYEIDEKGIALSNEDPLGFTTSVAREYECSYHSLSQYDSFNVLKKRTLEDRKFGETLRNRELKRIFKRKDGTLRDYKGNVINVEKVSYDYSLNREEFLGSEKIPKTQLNQRVYRAVVNEVYEKEDLAEAQFYTFEPSYSWRNREKKLPDFIGLAFFKPSDKPAEPVKPRPQRIKKLKDGRLVDFKGNVVNAEQIGGFHICNNPLNVGLEQKSRRTLTRKVRDKIENLFSGAGGGIYELKYYTLNMSCNPPHFGDPKIVTHVSIKFYKDKILDTKKE